MLISTCTREKMECEENYHCFCDWGDEHEGLTLYCDGVGPKPGAELSLAKRVYVDGQEWAIPGSCET